jgi:hypothetical protein
MMQKERRPNCALYFGKLTWEDGAKVGEERSHKYIGNIATTLYAAAYYHCTTDGSFGISAASPVALTDIIFSKEE